MLGQSKLKKFLVLLPSQFLLSENTDRLTDNHKETLWQEIYIHTIMLLNRHKNLEIINYSKIDVETKNLF